MSRIQKSFATTIGVIGVFNIVCGAASAICSWILLSNIEKSVSLHNPDGAVVLFGPFWIGGLCFVIPGIFALTTWCTRNVCVMTFYLVFDILSLLASIGFSVWVTLALILWLPANEVLTNSICITLVSSCVCSSLTVSVGVSCEELASVQPLLLGALAGCVLNAILTLVTSYISCCSLCNLETEPAGMFVMQQTQQITPGVYPPPTAAGHMMNPPAYSPDVTHDKSSLVHNISLQA